MGLVLTFYTVRILYELPGVLQPLPAISCGSAGIVDRHTLSIFHIDFSGILGPHTHSALFLTPYVEGFHEQVRLLQSAFECSDPTAAGCDWRSII